ncbi:MAG: hypothetical protein AB7F95_10120 [Burkholderiales bacterium]
MAPEKINSRVRIIGYSVVTLGLLLHVAGLVLDWDGQPPTLSLAVMVWSWLPYLIAMLLLFTMRRTVIPLVAATGPLLVDVTNYFSVFVQSPSSTGSLNLLWMPFWNLIIVGPLGLVIGWILSRTRLFDAKEYPGQ